MNRRGQALVEFVLILPVFLFILFIIVDFGRIFNSKNELENISNDVSLMIMNGEDSENIIDMYDDIDISIDYDGDYYNVVLKSSIDLFTPGLGVVIDNPYIVSVKRVVPYGED